MEREFMAAWLSRLERWVEWNPVAGSAGQARLADELVAHLGRSGLDVERHVHSSGDLLIASHRGRGPLLGVYGHYDVEPGGAPTLRVDAGRVFGRGVADNLGPLALRLEVLERVAKAELNLIWLIEPGEEVGSPALASWLATAPGPFADLWIDETGYFESDGTQRVLLVDSDTRAVEVVARCEAITRSAGRCTRIESRRLHRVAPRTGSFVETLFLGAPYLAIGPNDDASNVHGDMESLPLGTIEISARQFQSVVEYFCAGEVR